MDFDADGDTDILTGSWPGPLYLFRRGDDGEFGESETLTNTEGEEIDLGSASTVFAADWDTDGDLDLLVGDIRGNVSVVTNTGTTAEPVYDGSTRLDVSDEISQHGGDSARMYTGRARSLRTDPPPRRAHERAKPTTPGRRARGEGHGAGKW